MPISDRCYHIATSEGQLCCCLDLVMWTRLLVELQARRIVELELAAQSHPPIVLDLTHAREDTA